MALVCGIWLLGFIFDAVGVFFQLIEKGAVYLLEFYGLDHF